jgi:putative ABC transport system ATP-binding protein
MPGWAEGTFASPGEEDLGGHSTVDIGLAAGSVLRPPGPGRSPGMPAVECAGVTKHYEGMPPGVLALRGVDLTVEPGELLAVMGPSGCGKSTLLHMLGGLDTPTSGAVTVLDRRIDELSEARRAVMRRGDIGFIFQFFNLIANLSVADNVELPMLLLGASSADARERSNELLTTLGVEEQAKQSPRELSGGQQQRVAIARALANRPPLVLADEPTGNLDSAAAGEVLALLRDHAREQRSMVMVTHDPRVANVADRVAVLEDGAVSRELHPGLGEKVDMSLLSPITAGSP